MGRTLQRTSISVNIKERLDFSCALFDSNGNLVANAPHLPVHLGAMSDAVRYQVKYWNNDLISGDVLLSNHPQLAGGSHLPDITVITPIFINNIISFFVASRGHHADVGGIAPGSMPSNSKTLDDEGTAIIAFKIVKNGIFQEESLIKLLKKGGSRNISHNISDLKAQVAANERGTLLMKNLVDEYSLNIVKNYMNFIQNCAEESVKSMLYKFSIDKGMKEIDTISACDYLDDGTCINLNVTIDRKKREAIFDFNGTGFELIGNLNAPPAVTYSATIYCIRCMLPPTMDIPLNQGCLNPIKIIIPKNSLLNPSNNAAVVGGNVLTSQRVTDVILKAFDACAASQGCMNNVTFGDKTMGYYETIAGGAGAGPHWNGCHAVHTHMTNTRITDPETLEKRFPVNLIEFSIRKDSGGKGKFNGGNGVIRKIEFKKNLTLSVLTERRSRAPYGIEGGKEGALGLNLLHIKNDDNDNSSNSNSNSNSSSYRVVNLGAKTTIDVKPGSILEIRTPGGGGWGLESEKDGKEAITTNNNTTMQTGSLYNYTRNQESA